MYYLHKSAACLAACPDEGLSRAPALRWVRVLWPTLSERHRRVTWLLREVVSAVPGFQIRVLFRWSWALVFLSLLGTVVGSVSALLCPFLLPCWFASAVLNSGVGCVLQAELSVDAALMLPDDFDVALMRDWLGLKRSLTDCSWPVAPRPESASRSGCTSRYFDSRVRTPLARLLCP